MAKHIVIIFRCITLLISCLRAACGEDDRYLVCSHTVSEEFPESGWCRPVKLSLDSQLDEDLDRLRAHYLTWTHVDNVESGSNTTCGPAHLQPDLDPEIAHYVETVIAPFLELYHGGMRDSYSQMSHSMHQRVQKEMAAALATRDELYQQSRQLIVELDVPDYCSEEKRAAKRVSYRLVAAVSKCVERGRRAVDKMRSYLDEMIALSKKHLGLVNNLKMHLENLRENRCIVMCAFSFGQKVRQVSKMKLKIVNGFIMKFSYCGDVASCLGWLSAISVQLGYELQASTTHARAHHDVSGDRLDACVRDARAAVRAEHVNLHKRLHYCVEA